MQKARRTLLKSTSLLLIPTAVWSATARAATPTPPATAGPFYPASIPLDSDADLVKVEGKARIATGTIAHLTGKLLDQNGCPVAGAKIEIWQCDAFGAYHHPNDRGDIAEPEFQGYGSAITGGEGEYRFRTIRPVSYPGRTPHIHVRTTKAGMQPLTTQLYVEGEPDNQRDFLYNRIPADQRQTILARFPESPNESLTVVPEFNIILGVTSTC